MDFPGKDNFRLNNLSIPISAGVFEPASSTNAKQRAALVEWLNSVLPNLNLPINASDEELRVFLVDGTILCELLNKLKPGSVTEGIGSGQSSGNLKRFLSAMDEIGLPRFQQSDLEKGSMKMVLECLLTLKTHFMPDLGGFNISSPFSTIPSGNNGNTRWKQSGESPGILDRARREELSRTNSCNERRKVTSDSTFQRLLRSPTMAEPSTALLHHFGHKFHEVFQLKKGGYADLPAAKISEMMKSNSLDSAPTQSLLSVVNSILDESVERKNGEIPYRVACLLRKVVQEIERRISTQAGHLRTQNNLFRAREEKYQSRIRVLEALATGTSEEKQMVMNQLQQIKSEKTNAGNKKRAEEQDIVKLMKEKDDSDKEIAALRKELDIARKAYEEHRLQMETEAKGALHEEIAALRKELDLARKMYEERCSHMETEAKGAQHEEIASLMKELDIARKTYEERCMQMETESKRAQHEEIAALMKELDIARKAYEERCLQMETEAKRAQHEEIATLRNELDITRKTYEERCLQMETEAIGARDEEIAALKKELDIARKTYEEHCSQMETEAKGAQQEEIAVLRQELDIARKTYEERCSLMETQAKGAQEELEKRLKEVANLLTESRNRVKELETLSESKSQQWNKKEKIYQIFTEFQLGALRELRFASQSIRQEVVKTQKSFLEEFNHLGIKIKALQDAAQNYYAVLSENRKLHNEVQELKGNIRVYCRIRPFHPGQKEKQSTIEYIGENGELIIANPSKPGKEGRRSFKFNKVYGPPATQAQVFADIQPLIRSVLDGYNVCIFAYGQTGSGKTYTMMGPDGATEEQWGINYRALNDLFRISQARETTFAYEIGAQMVEIYNEQIRDLLSSSQKSLGVLSTNQPNGLAVPDASMYPVNSPSDVLELMDIGLNNRAKGSTAMNERSSRSHSCVTIHVRVTDLKTGSTMRSSLHLVDLAGSERVDRSEVTGDRLKEAQHINKSLSALGDVIFALAQKGPHVPYRNSKLTQVLQSSLGGQAKTLMFVQLNPDAISYSETMSTLKFAERVSGVELGAAKSSKDGKDVRELMEQVASLRDKISKKDEEIEKLQLSKDLKNLSPGVNGEKRVTSSFRYGFSSSSTRLSSVHGTPERSLKLSGGKGSRLTEKAASDQDNYSDCDTLSIASSQNSSDDIRHPKEFPQQSNTAGGNLVCNFAADAATLRLGNAENEERLNDLTDSDLSVGTETDGSPGSNLLVHEGEKLSEKIDKPKTASRISRPPPKSLWGYPKASTVLKVEAAYQARVPEGDNKKF